MQCTLAFPGSIILWVRLALSVPGTAHYFFKSFPVSIFAKIELLSGAQEGYFMCFASEARFRRATSSLRGSGGLSTVCFFVYPFM